MRVTVALLIVIAFAFILIIPTVLSKNLKTKLENIDFSPTFPSLHPFPIAKDNNQKPPEITAKSAIVIDAKTGIVLFQKNPDVKHLPASTTKLMTAIVALEQCSPQTIVTVNNINNSGTQMGLASQDQLTVETLLYGLLINSGNDAAFALASTCDSNYQDFITSMNQKAKELQMNNTHFENPAGFDNSNQYSTARDLAKLAKVAVANPLIAKIVTTKSTILTDVSGLKIYYLENVNKLLGEVEGLEGVKTGQTEGSLEILVTKTTRQNNTVIVSVLGSYDRFGESKKLIEWTFSNHNWLNP